MSRTHVRHTCMYDVVSQCSSNANGSVKKKGRSGLYALLTSPLSRLDFPKCPTKVFRISFSVLRSQYAAVLQSEALVASVSRYSHNTGRYAFIRENHIAFCVCLSRVTAPFFPLSLFLLHSNLLFFHNGCDVETDYACIRQYKIPVYLIQFKKKSNKSGEAFYIVFVHVYCTGRCKKKN